MRVQISKQYEITLLTIPRQTVVFFQEYSKEYKWLMVLFQGCSVGRRRKQRIHSPADGSHWLNSRLQLPLLASEKALLNLLEDTETLLLLWMTSIQVPLRVGKHPLITRAWETLWVLDWMKVVAPRTKAQISVICQALRQQPSKDLN